MKQKTILTIFSGILLVLSAFNVNAATKNLRLTLGAVPGAAERTADGDLHGAFGELAKMLAAAYHEGDLTILGPSPLPESLARLENGSADAHLPIIDSPFVSDLPFAFASEPIGRVVFVLYTPANKPAPQLDKLKALNIEVSEGQEQMFADRFNPSNSMADSLRRVDAGELDGFVMEQEAADSYIRQTGLNNIRRQAYHTFTSRIAIHKGADTAELEATFSRLFKEVKGSEGFQKHLHRIHGAYVDWQPYER